MLREGVYIFGARSSALVAWRDRLIAAPVGTGFANSNTMKAYLFTVSIK